MKRISLLGHLIMATSLFSSANADVKTDTAAPKVDTKKAKTPKIAYVNIQRIVPSGDKNELAKGSDEWRDLFNKLEKTLEPAIKELTDLKAKYQKGETEFEALQKSSLTTKETLQKKGEEVARIAYELRMRSNDYGQIEQNEFNKAQAQIGPKLDAVINEVRKSQGWDMVLRREVILSASDEFDITKDVLELLNKNYAAEKAKKAAAAKTAKS